MIVIDGLSLVLPPCGIKSFIYSFLISLSKHISSHGSKSKYIVLFPETKMWEGLGDYKTIDSIKNQLKNKDISFQPVIISSILLFLLKIIGRKSSFRRHFTFLWSFYTFPSSLKKLKNSFSINAVFHPYQIISNYSIPAKKTVVIHDIFHWLNFQEYNFIDRFFYQLAAQACQASDWVITVSEFSKQQIINYLKISAEKISVCYEGINLIYQQKNFPQNFFKNIRGKFNLPRRFILAFLSTRKYKKNVLGSVRLYHELLRIQPNYPCQLVLVGGNIDSNQEVKQYLINNQLLDRTRFVEAATDNELKLIYHMADYLFFLSLEEGFGLPPLEALACNTFPVISNTSSLGEIYSPYLPTFNPYKLKPIAQYLSALTLNQRGKIILAARKPLLNLYNWDKVIENYLKVFEA